jgi:hypothetical protein
VGLTAGTSTVAAMAKSHKMWVAEHFTTFQPMSIASSSAVGALIASDAPLG